MAERTTFVIASLFLLLVVGTGAGAEGEQPKARKKAHEHCRENDECETGLECIPVLGHRPLCYDGPSCYGAYPGGCPVDKKTGREFSCTWVTCDQLGLLQADCVRGDIHGQDSFGKYMCVAAPLEEISEKLAHTSCDTKRPVGPRIVPETMNRDLETIEMLNYYNDESQDQVEETFGLNRFTGCSEGDFFGHFGLEVPENPEEMVLELDLEVFAESLEAEALVQKFENLPKKLDWRESGMVSPVKKQGTCNSCWAHVAAQTVESASMIAKHDNKEFSVQQILECVTPQDYPGSRPVCNTGGFYQTGFMYTQRNGGLQTVVDYPLTATEMDDSFGACRQDTGGRYDGVDGGVLSSWGIAATSSKSWNCGCNCDADQEKNMAVALATKGPLAAAIRADDLKYYKSGVVKNLPLRCTQSLNHAVQIVGFNMENNPPYWIVRNTWGTSWGLEGYFHVEMFKNNLGIANLAMYAVGKKAACSSECNTNEYCDEDADTCRPRTQLAASPASSDDPFIAGDDAGEESGPNGVLIAAVVVAAVALVGLFIALCRRRSEYAREDLNEANSSDSSSEDEDDNGEMDRLSGKYRSGV